MNRLKSRLTDGLGIALLLGIVGVALLVVLLSAFWPYHPYELEGYSVSPKTACPGEVVSVALSRTMKPGHYEIEVDGQWSKVGSNRFLETPIGNYSIDIPPGPELEQNIVSPLLQEAPEMQGDWIFEADITVIGRVGVLPRSQVVEEKDGESLTVYPVTHRDCALKRE